MVRIKRALTDEPTGPQTYMKSVVEQFLEIRAQVNDSALYNQRQLAVLER